jgi:hypothetical protein
VESFIPKALLFEATCLRRSAEVRKAGTTILTHVLGCRHFLQAVCCSFHDQVLNSHGNHISQRVRDAAAWVFWLPRILIDPRLKMGAAEKVIAKSLGPLYLLHGTYSWHILQHSWTCSCGFPWRLSSSSTSNSCGNGRGC